MRSVLGFLSYNELYKKDQNKERIEHYDANNKLN